MVVSAVIALTLTSICCSLWIRRVTWHCRWEIAATLNLALQGAAVALMSPAASATLGVRIYTLTGLYNVEDYLAHMCYIVAASAVVYNAAGRLALTRRDFQLLFKRHVELPLTFCIPVLLAAFVFSDAADVYVSNFLRLQADRWLNVYWLVLCGVGVYLWGFSARVLLVLREDERSRGIATAYLVACGFGVAACLVRVVTGVSPLDNDLGAVLVWVFAGGCGVVFAVAGARSWSSKLLFMRFGSRDSSGGRREVV